MPTLFGEDISINGDVTVAKGLDVSGIASLANPLSEVGGNRILSTLDLISINAAQQISGTFVANLLNVDSANTVSSNVSWVKTGNTVMLSFSPINSTTDGNTTFGFSGLPNFLYPTDTRQVLGMALTNNTMKSAGWMKIDSNGVVSFSSPQVAGPGAGAPRWDQYNNWSSVLGAPKAWDYCTITYQI